MFTTNKATGDQSGSPSNTLHNLFPSTHTPQATQTKLERLLYSTNDERDNRGSNGPRQSRRPTEMQRTLAYSLFDDNVEYMTTLEMNRAASYTFGFRNSYGLNGTPHNDTLPLGGGTHGESLADELWDLLLGCILKVPTQHSILCLTKTMAVLEHILMYGSDSCIFSGGDFMGGLLHQIEMTVEPLRRLNTAMIEQKLVESILNNESDFSFDGLNIENLGYHISSLSTRATATLFKLRGGSVDKGHSVRVAAEKLYGIVCNADNLKRLRLEATNTSTGGGQGDGNSLVPIGTSKQVAFITDDARFRLLQQKMERDERKIKQRQLEEQKRLKQTKSNLAAVSAKDGFGGGYVGGGGASSSAGVGGKTVVGAAHSLQDMIASAKYELEQAKLERKRNYDRELLSLQKGYSDDPKVRARQLQELEHNQNAWETDPKVLEKERTLKEALEYLEELERTEKEERKVSDGDLLGVNNFVSEGSDVTAGIKISGNTTNFGAADLLGFDDYNKPTPYSVDPFNGQVDAAGGSVDLLGFDSLLDGSKSSSHNGVSTVPSSTAAQNTIEDNCYSNNYSDGVATKGIHKNIGSQSRVEIRPSLVTGLVGGSITSGRQSSSISNNFDNDLLGMSMTHSAQTCRAPNSTSGAEESGFMIDANETPLEISVMGGIPGTSITSVSGRLHEGIGFDTNNNFETSRSKQPVAPLSSPENEDANADRERKMKMAEGLFAGVIPGSPSSVVKTIPDDSKGRNLIMGQGINSSSALDELIPVSETSFGISPLGMGASEVLASGSFGMEPGGGNAGTVIPPPPAMDPPMPPPSMPPPPPPATVAISTAEDLSICVFNSVENNNQSISSMHQLSSFENMSPEQLRQMMIQQQAQMQQMMNMMMTMGLQQAPTQSQQGRNPMMMREMPGMMPSQPLGQGQSRYSQSTEQYLDNGNQSNGVGE